MPRLRLQDTADVPDSPTWGLAVWSMNTTCPYRCTYCGQEFRDEHDRWRADLPVWMRALGALRGRWEIKLTGGEPLSHPEIADVVQQLGDQGRRISVLSGFMATKAELQAVAVAAGPLAGTFSASMHLDYVQPERFLARLGWFEQVWQGTVEATVVATRADVIRLPRLVARFSEAGIPLRIRAHREGGGTAAYSLDERAVLLQHGGHLGSGDLEFHLRGRICWAGARYFTMDSMGNAWRCSSARRQRIEPLGNVLDGSFRLGSDPHPCLYNRCTSTEVLARRLVGER